MPRTRQDRSPERTDGITVELTEFGLWIEVQDQGGGWEGIFLSARTLRRLVALPAEERLAALAALDPATLAARRPGRRPTSTGTGTGQPGAA
jgi:hypothetical protein